MVGFTGLGCFIIYECIIRRIGFLRPLFGLKGVKGSGYHVEPEAA